MSTRLKVSFVASFAALLLAAGISSVLAATVSTTSPQMIAAMITRSDKEITARVTALTTLEARIGQIKNVSASDKSTLSATIQTQIADMTNLKAKIDADTDAVVLKTDLQSITKDYRIYALILPQGQILAAADRVSTIAADILAVGLKLQTRITAAQTAGKDVTALQTSLSDLQAKATDAQTQAESAMTSIASLVPDQGDKTVAASNLATLKAARADIKTGTSDLQTARKDAGSILKAIQAFKLPVTASTTVSVSTN